jgi:uncharacterized protein YkvS
MTTLKLGDQVRNSDGILGHVVKVRDSLDGVVLVDWKFAGKYRTSNAKDLTVENNKTYRWRK